MSTPRTLFNWTVLGIGDPIAELILPLTEQFPPGDVFLVDENGALLVDENGAFLVEP